MPPQSLELLGRQTASLDFNYDFHVTNDPKARPPEYNCRTLAENKAHNSPNGLLGEEHGLTVFFTLDGDIRHTYSAYGRDTELFADARLIVDATRYGGQHEFEDPRPAGRKSRRTGIHLQRAAPDDRILGAKRFRALSTVAAQGGIVRAEDAGAADGVEYVGLERYVCGSGSFVVRDNCAGTGCYLGSTASGAPKLSDSVSNSMRMEFPVHTAAKIVNDIRSFGVFLASTHPQ